jgi:hypothetical protein
MKSGDGHDWRSAVRSSEEIEMDKSWRSSPTKSRDGHDWRSVVWSSEEIPRSSRRSTEEDIDMKTMSSNVRQMTMMASGSIERERMQVPEIRQVGVGADKRSGVV